MRIYVNQAGYLPKSKKLVVLAEDTRQSVESLQTESKRVRILDSQGNCILEKEAGCFGFDAASGDMAWQADFSELEQPGMYKIEDESGTYSHTFKVDEEIYNELNQLLCKALYYQRCGMELKEEYAGVFSRKGCHEKDAVLYEEYVRMCSGDLDEKELQHFDVRGGWHDAGDYGRYTTAAATALGHILYAWKWFPESFAAGLKIPESGNGIPDILNECLYELKWMLKMQRADGAVWHKLTTLRHANFVMPCEDKEQLLLSEISSMACGDFVAIMALASRVYAAYDADFAKQALGAAQQTWKWLETHTEYVGFQNPKESNTGEYGDGSDKDERFWAAVEMYYATGLETYLDTAETYLKDIQNKTALGWADMAGFGGLALIDGLMTGRESQCTAERRLQEQYKDYFLQEAEHLLQTSDKCGYKVALSAKEYCWGSNMVVLNRGIILAVAHLLSGDRDYHEGAQQQMDYLLGVNAVDYSYVTGVGERAFCNPHNRVTEADGIPETIPGFVSGGPNGRPADEKAEWLIKPRTPPMKCYLDIWECYSLNEITIYWNSPAIFLAAFLQYQEPLDL